MIEGCDWEKDFEESKTPSTPRQNAIAFVVAAIIAAVVFSMPIWLDKTERPADAPPLTVKDLG